MEIKKYTQTVEEGLKALKLRTAEVPTLYEPIRYTLDGGGKRLRPVLAMMVCEALGGTVEEALSPALGIEVFHNFTLLHDDVMDRSDMRRGRPTVHACWDENTAILSGDAMLTLATMLVSEVDDNILARVLKAFNKGAMDVYEGQALDMDFEQRSDVTLPEYINMISLKTGALLATALKIGALTGNAAPDFQATTEALYEYGMKLGIAFQIHDDYLDIYGNEKRLGKPIGGDVQNNKKTYLLLSALESGGAEAEALRCAMLMECGSHKLTVFREIYDKLGMAQKSRQATIDYCNAAIAALDKACISEEWRRNFEDLALSLTDRDK